MRMDTNELFKQVLDGTNQLIQYSTRSDFRMLYANKAARDYTAHGDLHYEGEHCYKYMMGLDDVCPFCPMRSMPEGTESFETEIDNGQQVFSVKTELFHVEGQELFIEYATDITAVRRAQQLYETQTQMILSSIPEAQGIFYMNLSANRVISVNGIATAVEHLRNEETADFLLHSVGNYVPDKDARDKFAKMFSREHLMQCLDQGENNVSIETRSYFSDGSVRWARVTAKLMKNPTTGDSECIVYGIDIDDAINYKNKLDAAEKNYSRLQEIAKRDLLTGLYGKIAFDNILTAYLRDEIQRSCAVVFMDIDNFKKVNDTIGHIAGDEVIVDVADKLQSIFKNKDIIARFGGDEFCILVKEISVENLKDKLAYVIERLHDVYENGGKSVEVSVSIGAAYYEKGEPLEPDELIRLSDQALYRAKYNGKNDFVIVRNEKEILT